ncbi:MAG: LysM peptidoglycan-binding domain-containing protein [Proteobacteria bacterium]|nr:LysM peptidoglycan-binding domain-containing protein [Pseudomonadota bacterium]
MKNGEATVSAKKTAISSARAGAVTALLGVLALLPLPLDAAIDHGDARSLGTTFAVDSRFPRVVAKDNGDTLDARDEPLPVLAQGLPRPPDGAAAPETAKDLTDSLWPPKELGVADRVQDWLARANREFQTTIIRRLSTPAAGGDADAIARKIEQVKREDAEAAARRAKEALDAAQAKLAAEAEARHSQELSDAAAKAAEQAKAREAEAARLEAQRKADEAKRLAEEQKRQDQLRLAAEEKAAQQRAVEEAAAKTAAAKKAEEERKAEAERQALKVAEEAKAKAQEEAGRKAAEDAKRVAAEEAAKAAAKERELAAQRAAEAAAKKAEEERKADAERQALKAAEEAKAKAAEEARRKAEEDAKRIAAEEAAKAAADREAKAKEAAEKVRLAEEAAKRDADAKRAAESAKQAMADDADKAKTGVAATPSAAEPSPVKVQLKAAAKKVSSRGEKGVARKRPHSHAHAHRSVKRRVVVAANNLARGPVVKPWVRRARQGRCRAAGEKVLLPGRYTVARGDNLWRIALRHYGSGLYFKRIYRANRNVIRDPSHIYACERLYLPRR